MNPLLAAWLAAASSLSAAQAQVPSAPAAKA